MRRLAACPQTARWIVGMVVAASGLVLAAGAILCTALFLGARAHDAASIHALFRAQAVSSAGMLQQRLRTLVSGGCGMVVLVWVMQRWFSCFFLRTQSWAGLLCRLQTADDCTGTHHRTLSSALAMLTYGCSCLCVA